MDRGSSSPKGKVLKKSPAVIELEDDSESPSPMPKMKVESGVKHDADLEDEDLYVDTVDSEAGEDDDDEWV